MGIYGFRDIIYYIYSKSPISNETYHEIMKTAILDCNKKEFKFDKTKCRCNVINIDEDRIAKSSYFLSNPENFKEKFRKWEFRLDQNLLDDIVFTEKEKSLIFFIKEKLGDNFDESKSGWHDYNDVWDTYGI